MLLVVKIDVSALAGTKMRRNFWRFEDSEQNGVGRAQNSRVFRDAPTGLDLRR